MPASLAGKFQDALAACEVAGRCETPAVVVAAPEPPLLRRAVHFDVAPNNPNPEPSVAPPVVPEAPAAPQKMLSWLAGKKGWIGAVVGLVVVALLAVAAMYVRKHFVRPMLFGGKQKSSYQPADPPKHSEGNLSQASLVPPPPVIPAFARRRVRFKETPPQAPQRRVLEELPPEEPEPPKAQKKRRTVQPPPQAAAPAPSEEDEVASLGGEGEGAADDPGYEPL